jgi:hypothetical protein
MARRSFNKGEQSVRPARSFGSACEGRYSLQRKAPTAGHAPKRPGQIRGGVYHDPTVDRHPPPDRGDRAGGGQPPFLYRQVLGLRLVKKTVNQDDTSAYHLFYADGLANPPAPTSPSSTGRSAMSGAARTVYRAHGPARRKPRARSNGGRPALPSSRSRPARSMTSAAALRSISRMAKASASASS